MTAGANTRVVLTIQLLFKIDEYLPRRTTLESGASLMHHGLIPGSAAIAILATLIAEGTDTPCGRCITNRGAAEWYPTPLRQPIRTPLFEPRR
jgi:hypothetical protein